MGLRYSFTEMFRNRFPVPNILYAQLEDLQDSIENGADAKPIVKEDVKLTKSGLKKAFGDPSKFDNIGIVNNVEGSYLVVASDKKFKYIALEDI